MQTVNLVNYEQTMEEVFEINRKLAKGIGNILSIREIDVEKTPRELVYSDNKMKLYHYKTLAKEVCPVPTLIVYALVNRQYMMDLQQDRSFIRNLLERGQDLYIIDWGYPDKSDRYITLEDYIDGYINDAVDFIRKRSGRDSINLLGVCQGGTFSVVYAALYPDKIKNLVTMVTPVDFDTEDGLLFKWSRYMDVDKMVNAYGNIPGEFMNAGFLMLKPVQLMLDKYVGFIENLDRREVVENFLRMEKWIFDSPDQAGEAYRQFIKYFYQQNLLVQNKLEIGGRKVNLKKITMPLLNIFAEKDHLVPPSTSRPLNDLVGSKDKEIMSVPAGHIGIYVSSRAQNEIAPKVASWLMERSVENAKPASGGKKK